MKLEKIITLANKKVELPFIAMERSLRATGCELPLWVIPYDDDKFELPEGSKWFENKPILQWLNSHKAHRSMRKYACLLEKAYQFIDTDCIFIRSPESALEGQTGFIASCCHWHNPDDTQFAQSKTIFKSRTTTWQRFVFNAGQFACDRSLYEIEDLKKTGEQLPYKSTILDNPYNDQPGLNLLVFLKSPPFVNLTLPPYNMESTWAGDYIDTYTPYWKSPAQTPYFIHWAGCKADGRLKIDQLFFDYLSSSEKKAYQEQFLDVRKKPIGQQMKNRLRQAWKAFNTIP